MIRACAAGMLLLALAACGGSEAVKRDTRLRTDDSVAPAVGTLELRNRGDAPICYVYLAPSAEGDLKPTDAERKVDHLGFDELVAPRSNRIFTVTTPGRYDLRLADCDGNPLFQQPGLMLRATGTTLDFP